MSTLPYGPNPDDEQRRNLAIQLGFGIQPRVPNLSEPQMAAPPSPQKPDNRYNLALSQPRTNELGTPLVGPAQQEPPQPSSLDKAKAEQQRLRDTGSGISQISKRIQGTGFGQAHPTLGKILGGLAQTGATIGDIALNVGGGGLGRLAAMEIPGTQEHHQLLLNQEGRQVTQEEANQEKEAQTAAQQAQIPLREAETGRATAEADRATAEAEAKRNAPDRLENPQQGYAGAISDAIRRGVDPANDPHVQAWKTALDDVQRQATPKEMTPEQKAYDAAYKEYIAKGLTPAQAQERLREKAGGTTINQGTWSLQEDENGKPVLLNSKTGETKPAPGGVEKAGTHAKAETERKKEMNPIESAVGYASDYLNNGVFTGPGDEALQEKFFELAKPSTGFRMTQQQMQMLADSRSWMGSIKAKAYHAATGTWFSDDQRKQIVDTMNQLAEEKRKAVGQGTAPTGAPQGASDEVYVKGKLVGHVVDKKYVPLEAK